LCEALKMPVLTIDGAQGGGNCARAMIENFDHYYRAAQARRGLGALDRQNVSTLTVRFPRYARAQLGATILPGVEDCAAGAQAITLLKRTFLAVPESMRSQFAIAVGRVIADFDAIAKRGQAAYHCDEYRAVGLRAQALAAQMAQAAGLPPPGVPIAPTLVERAHRVAERVDEALATQTRERSHLATETKVILGVTAAAAIGTTIYLLARKRRRSLRRRYR
jgi:hypothetical protein